MTPTFRSARRLRPAPVALALILFALAPGARTATGQPAPLRVDDVVARALAQNPLVDAARARVAAARGARRTAGVLPNPILTYWTEGGPFPGRAADARFQRETQTYGTLPLEPLVARGSRVRRADAEVRAADADLARARQTVALDAARAFYRVAAAQVAVDAVDDVRVQLTELARFTGARVREGRTAEADLIRTQVEEERLATEAALQRAELARAQALLAPYLGVGGAAAVAAAEPASVGGDALDALRVVVDDNASAGAASALPLLSAMVTAAGVRRPDVRAARERAAAARAEVGVQQSLLARQLAATFGSKRTAGVTSMIASVSVPLPLFDRNRGEVQRAAALRTAADDELAWAERQADAEVRAAYAATRLLDAQTTRLQGGFLVRAEESRRIALAAYREGAVTLLQVLDASRTLADARQLYYRTLFARRLSLLELRAAAGEDLAGDSPAAPVGAASERSPGAPRDASPDTLPDATAALVPITSVPRPTGAPGGHP